MHYLQKQLLEEEKKKAKLNAGHCKTESEKLDESKKKKNGEKARSVLTKANIPHDMVMGVIRVPANLVGKVEALLDKEFGGMFKKRTGFKIAGTFKEAYELNERLDVEGILSSWGNVINIINQVMETINSGLPQHSEFDAMVSMVDYDGDGQVTFTDLTIALGLWGQGIMPATAQQYQAGQLMYDDSGLGDGKLNQDTRPPRPTPRPLPQRFSKPAIGQIPEGYELNEQKGQKFNFARARKVFEKHWREMERKVVNELVQPYEGRGPVNYDLKAERQVSDYFETNTEDLLDYITERFEDLNSSMNESLGGFSGVGGEIKKLSRKLKYEKDVRRAINKRRPTLDTPYPYAGYPIDPYQFGGMRGPNRSTEDDRP